MTLKRQEKVFAQRAPALVEVQLVLLDIVTSVKEGTITPEKAVKEFEELKERATLAGLPFKANYVLADFQKISPSAPDPNYYETSTTYDYDSTPYGYETSGNY
jgi:hypothetical protein